MKNTKTWFHTTKCCGQLQNKAGSYKNCTIICRNQAKPLIGRARNILWLWHHVKKVWGLQKSLCQPFGAKVHQKQRNTFVWKVQENQWICATQSDFCLPLNKLLSTVCSLSFKQQQQKKDNKFFTFAILNIYENTIDHSMPF